MLQFQWALEGLGWPGQEVGKDLGMQVGMVVLSCLFTRFGGGESKWNLEEGGVWGSF